MNESHDEHTSPIKTPGQLLMVVLAAFLVPIIGISLLAALITSGSRIDPKSPAMSDDAVAERLKPIGEVVVTDAAKGSNTGAGAEAAAGPESPAAPPADGKDKAATKGQGAATVLPEPAAAPANATSAKPAADAGKSVYEVYCVVCHASGAADAPKFGDKTAWAPRIQTGIDTLYASALKGKGAMPPKGGNVSLPDADVKAAVDYLVSQAK